MTLTLPSLKLRLPRLERRPSAQPRRADILPPFTRAVDRQRLRPVLIGAGLGLFCFVYGLAYAFMTPFFLVAFVIPPVVILGLVIWALPELKRAPVKLTETLFFVFAASLVVWPPYLAIALPGLPWLTIVRLTGFPMAVLFLVCVASSSQVRREIGQALSAAPVVWRLVVLFVVLQAISLVFSSKPSFSMQKFITAQVTWTAAFFLACYLFQKPRRIETWAVLLWVTAILVSVIGVWESRLGHVPWLGHIPKFLQIDDPSVMRALGGSSRYFVDKYRVQGTFTTALGMGEFLALTLPFVLHFMTSRTYGMKTRLAAGASVVFLIYSAILTGARSAMIGVLIGGLLHTLAVAIRASRRRKENIFAAAITYGYPVVFLGAIAFILTFGRVRTLFLGNGSEQGSNDARVAQYTIGIPKILSHPFGHGMGMAADALGYAPYGMITIDTYYLAVGLEYGVIGFFAYYGMILISAWTAGRRAVFDRREDRDYAFLTPIAIALTSFFVIKSVFSEQDNHPLVFMMLGAVAALCARAPAAAKTAAPVQTGRATIANWGKTISPKRPGMVANSRR